MHTHTRKRANDLEAIVDFTFRVIDIPIPHAKSANERICCRKCSKVSIDSADGI